MPRRKRKQDRLSREILEEEYGLSYALFKSFPELNKLLKDAVNGPDSPWSPAKFQAELRNTKWFKKHSDVWREHIALKKSDPATYRERLNNSLTVVQNLAGAFSARMTPKAQRRLAERALMFGLSDDQVRDQLAAFVRPGAGGYEGQLAGIEDQLQATAMRNGIRYGKKEIQRWMREVVRGNATTEELENLLRKQAAATFGVYGEQIKAGMDLADIANPYIQAMASTLELSPGSLDLFDPTLRRALGGVKNEKNGEREPMSITDFEDALRRDKRWQFTNQARERATGITNALGRLWGLS